MTFNEVNKILETMDFNMNCCSILDKPFVKAGDGVVAVLDKGAYKVYYVERNEPYDIKEFFNENDASNDFLRRLRESFGNHYCFPKNAE